MRSRGLGQVLLGLLALFAWGAPLLFARLFADPLDRAPYVICLVGGLLLGAAASVALWAAARAGLAGMSSGRAVGGMVAIVLFAPTYAVGIGLGINRRLDRSPRVEHDCRVLEWRVPAKSGGRCLVTSWRGRDAEVLGGATIMTAESAGAEAAGVARGGASSSETQGRFPRACVPGSTVVVYSRAGRLGWEWIEGVRAPPSSSPQNSSLLDGLGGKPRD